MSMTSLPRKQILAFGNLCQSNLMYFLFRSFYTHVGWGQRLFYKGIQMFIDEETKQKIVLAADGAPEALVQMFHSCQLEKRFGGAMPTPTRFWPPHIGSEFIPEGEVSEKHKIISPSEYERILAENPELPVHPMHLKPGRCENRHIKMADVESAPGPTGSSQYNLTSQESEVDLHSNVAKLRYGSTLTQGTTRGGSIYHDAYSGFDEIEEQK